MDSKRVDLTILLQPQNFDLIVCCVDNPDALAREACEAGLMSPEMMTMLMSNTNIDNRAKTRNMLQYIMGVVSLQPHLYNSLLAVLRNQPDVNNLLIILQGAGMLSSCHCEVCHCDVTSLYHFLIV